MPKNIHFNKKRLTLISLIGLGALILGAIFSWLIITGRLHIFAASSISNQANATFKNSAGATLSASSNILTINYTPPSDTQAPTVPTNLSGTPTSTQVSLTWTASTDNVAVTGYDLRRNGTVIKVITPPATTYTDSTVAAGQTYTYDIDAFDAAGNHSAYSTPPISVTVPPPSNKPAAPTNFKAAAVSPSQIDLSWTDNATNELGYTIYRSLVSDFSTVEMSKDLPADTTSFSDTALLANTHYWYRVSAWNSAGGSSYVFTDAITSVAISLVKSADKTQTVSGEIINYTITWKNNSAYAVLNITISDPVPDGTTFISASSGVTPDPSNNIKWTIPSASSGATGTVTFKVQVQ